MSVITCCDLCGRVSITTKQIEVDETFCGLDLKVHYYLCNFCYEHLKKPKKIERPVGLIDRFFGRFKKSVDIPVVDKQVVYLCDRRQCERCTYPECKHTCDLEHAENFTRVDKDKWMEKED